MTEEIITSFTNSLKDKLGEENMALISDDLGSLITSNTIVSNSLTEKDARIQKLQETNEKLVLANGSLLQQVAVAPEPQKHQTDEGSNEPKKSFNLKSAFDEKGRFKSNL